MTIKNENQAQSINYLALIYPVIYLVAAIYNFTQGNMLFVYLWSSLFIINSCFFVYNISKKKK